MTPDSPALHSDSNPSPPSADGYFPQQPTPPMALDNDTILKLIHQLETDRKAYLATFEKIHGTLAQALHPQPRRPESRLPSVSYPPTSLPSAERKASISSSHVLHREAHHPKESIMTAEGTSDSEDDETFFAQETLSPRDFTEADLIEHLKTHTWDIYSKYILQDLLRHMNLLENGIFLKDRHHQTDANHQHADIYHIGTDGAPLRFSRGDSDEGPLAAWEALKSINMDNTRRQAVGRIIIVREPASSLFAALHLTMKEYFDMDSIYRILIDDYTPTKAITKGYLKEDTRRQRSIVFVFKYHTIVGKGRAPLHWQNHDEVLESKDGTIPLTTCSSVVALSLAGRPSYTLRRNSRKSKSIIGHVYDPFAPWHVLSIQCFPDWNSSVDAHEHNHHYCNGPDAFLATVLSEYRDAVKRFKEVHRKIQNLATPPNRSIFDSALRDELLFENDKYTYSRRYFWASQTLGLLSNEIKAMISSYNDTFTDDFWSGEHKTLFPGTKDQSARYSNWRRKLTNTRRQFEKVLVLLEDVLKTFQQQQKEIRGLREWLFSGTSVLESREAVSMAKIAVEQGYNIRLLTLVTLFYLPLSYVTGIYGMTNMPVDDSYLPFALTTVGICLPTYLLILIVNYPDKVRASLANIGLFFVSLTSLPAPKKSERLKKKLRERRMPHPDAGGRPILQKAATFASLEARLSQELHADDTSLHGTQAFMAATRRMSQSISNHLPGAAGRRTSLATAQISPILPTYSEEMNEMERLQQRQQRRSSTVKFDEPLYSATRWRTAQDVHEDEEEDDEEEHEGSWTRATRWRTASDRPSPPAAATGAAGSRHLNLSQSQSPSDGGSNLSPTERPPPTPTRAANGSPTIPSPIAPPSRAFLRVERTRDRSVSPGDVDVDVDQGGSRSLSMSLFGRLGSRFGGMTSPSPSSPPLPMSGRARAETRTRTRARAGPRTRRTDSRNDSNSQSPHGREMV